MSAPAEWVSRACTIEDVGTVLALAKSDEERVSSRPSRLVEGDVRDWWQSIDLATDSWLFIAPASGAAVGVVWLDVQGTSLGASFPIATDSRVMQTLVDVAERRAAEVGVERLQIVVLVPDQAAADLLTEKGYSEVRRFFEMAIHLEGPPSPMRLPEGFTLQAATTADAPAFHETIDSAFSDHWEHHPLPFDEWWSRRTGDPDFDISWWFIVREGDDLVAAIRNVPGRNGGVYVASLGVRRGWRGRGLAKALLLHTFGRAYEAGFRRITLGVDATNPTGATALYHRVGMTTELESAVWEKALALP